MNTSLKIYVTAAVLTTASLAYAQTQDTATTPSTTPAVTSSTPAATTPSTTPAATNPVTSGETQDGAAATPTTEDADDNRADDDTSLAPRSDRN